MQREVSGASNSKFGHQAPRWPAGARVAVAGLKTTHPLLAPLNLWAWWPGRPYRTTDANLRTPWTHLLRWVPDFRWHTVYAGTGYIGSGMVR